MGTQVTLTIPDELYHRAQRIAQSRRKDIAEVLADAIVLTEETEGAVESEMDKAIERERAAYLAMHSALLEKYKGEYVAVYRGRLIDHDPDFATLYARINRQYPDEFVLIRQVETQPERTYHFRSPRFAEEK